jgi:hypothetical protein
METNAAYLGDRHKKVILKDVTLVVYKWFELS